MLHVLLIYIYIQKEVGSQNKFKLKIPEGQENVPRLEPTAPIRLADRNHAHYPSRHRTILKKDGSMTDYQHMQYDPHGSHQKMFHVLFEHLGWRCSQAFDCLPFGSGEKTSGHTMDLVCQVYV